MRKPENPFVIGMRVSVNLPGLEGQVGTVIKALKRSPYVWVEMDKDLPDALRTFDALDPRARQISIPIEDAACVGASVGHHQGQ